MTSILTPVQLEQFERNGYLLLPNFFTQDETNEMLAQSKKLVSEFSMENHPMTKFTPGDTENSKEYHVGDEYFLNSGDKIHFFLEPDAVGPDGKLNRPKERAVNKFGHGLHMLDPVFRKYTLEDPRVRQITADLGLHRDPRILQSMVICKQPSIGGVVPLHNDSTFLYTSPPSAVGLWIPLENCTLANGCLSFLPGSQKTTRITKRLVRLPGGGTGFEQLEADDPRVDDPDADGLVAAEIDAGTLVLIHGSVLHRSSRNTSDKSRFAYTFHIIDGELEYDEKNWLQPTPEAPFSKLFG